MSNNAEQISTVPSVAECAENVGKTEENSFGKFKTKESLIEAYNSLEAEFTRRSQKIKELEAAIGKQTEDQKWEGKVKELTNAFPVASSVSNELKAYITEHKELLEREDCLQVALLNVLASKAQAVVSEQKTEKTAEETKLSDDKESEKTEEADNPKNSFNNSNGAKPKNYNNNEILEYMKSLESAPLPAVGKTGGEIPVAAPYKPKSLQGAREFAEKFLKSTN